MFKQKYRGGGLKYSMITAIDFAADWPVCGMLCCCPGCFCHVRCSWCCHQKRVGAVKVVFAVMVLHSCMLLCCCDQHQAEANRNAAEVSRLLA